MIKCYKCGANQIDTNKKCVFCGADLTHNNTLSLQKNKSRDTNDIFNNSQQSFDTFDNHLPYQKSSERQNIKKSPILMASIIFVVAVLIINIVIIVIIQQSSNTFVPALQNNTQTIPTNDTQTKSLLGDASPKNALDDAPSKSLLGTENNPPAQPKPVDKSRQEIDVHNLNHKMVLDEIQKNKHIIYFSEKIALRDPKEFLDTVIIKLNKNKDCYENSEDLILWIGEDLPTFQKILKKIDYKQLYQAMADKHTNSNTCNNTKPTASWIEGIVTSPLVNSKTNLTEGHESHYCYNNRLYTDTSILDANLEIYYSIWKQTDTRSMFAGLAWNTGDFFYYRFFEPDDVMDSYAMTNVTGSFTFSYVENSDHGRQVLLKSKYAEHRPWINDLLHADDFQVVYGRFVKNDEDGYYFVLSYRKYTLKEMHERCPFVKNEFAKILKTDAEFQTAPESAPKQHTKKSVPDHRVKDTSFKREVKDSQLDLPF